MAMTKTTLIETIEIRQFADAETKLFVHTKNTWDDPDDSDAPVEKINFHAVERYQVEITYDEDGNETRTETPTDLSGEDQLVQDIAAVVWTD